MLCGEAMALSAMVTAAANAPILDGAKCPWIEQLVPIDRLVPQLSANTNEDASAPVTAMLAMDTAVVLVLVMVTDCDSLARPTVYFELDHPEQSESYERKALALSSKLVGRHDPRTLARIADFGTILDLQGKMLWAEPYYEEYLSAA